MNQTLKRTILIGAVIDVITVISAIFIFTGFLSRCPSYEPVTGTAAQIADAISIRLRDAGNTDIKTEVSAYGDCQKEIIERVKADAVGLVNDKQVYYDEYKAKYYWCDATNKVMVSSTNLKDLEGYFNTLYKCVRGDATTLSFT